MSDLRQRQISSTDHSSTQTDNRDERSDEDVEILDSEIGVSSQEKSASGNIFDSTLKGVSPRWKNWMIRGVTTLLMIAAFCLIIWLGPLCLVLLVGLSLKCKEWWKNWIIRTILTGFMLLSFSVIISFGPLALVFMILLIQVKCFHEIITIGYIVYKSHELPWFRTLSWYFLMTTNYFFYGESMMQYFGVLISRTEFLRPFVTYHRFISFSLYVAGFVAFVFSLVKKHYLKQFTLFGWTHVTLVIIVTQSHLIVQNIFEGLIWFLVPVSMIICNDIMAYLFGFFFGKTPLIKLSPKKTWEGFIGGAFSTVVFGIIISYFLVQFDYFVCPIEYNDVTDALTMECNRSFVFQLQHYNIPQPIQYIGSIFHRDWKTVSVYPFVLHSISMSVFASIIGPFGGFFASGFKRAFKIKDFGDTIPGHGGFMDRVDCQLLMATFVHVYLSSFIKTVSPMKLVQQILSLRPDEQLQVFNSLEESLKRRGTLSA